MGKVGFFQVDFKISGNLPVRNVPLGTGALEEVELAAFALGSNAGQAVFIAERPLFNEAMIKIPFQENVKDGDQHIQPGDGRIQGTIFDHVDLRLGAIRYPAPRVF
jgi:hypothetical protein